MAKLFRHKRSLTKDPGLGELAGALIAGNARLSPVRQLEIYREQFWLRHTASLLEDFPGLAGILGQRDWETLVESYLEETTLGSWSLRELGAGLPAHTEKALWLPHRELCVDMARLEWAYVELFDATDVVPVDPETLRAISEPAWETAKVTLSPALSLLQVRYPVAKLRGALRESRGVPPPIPERESEHLVLYRGADLGLYHVAVSRAAFLLLDGLRAGVPLLTACQRAADGAPSEDLEENVEAWFSDWGRRGWVVNVETS